MNAPVDIGGLVRFALHTMGERNAHHEFERLCLEVARRRLVSNLLPATGPVSSGGDQGRDGESFWTALAHPPYPLASEFAARASPQRVVLACTIQRADVPAKVRKDLAAITGQGAPVDRVLYFTLAPVPVAARHALQREAREMHDVELDVFDAMALTDFLTAPDLIHLAQRHLGLPSLPGMAGEPAGDLSVAVPEDAIEHHIRGRDALLAELAERTTHGGDRTVLCGVGGSGKSTVALALARRGRAEGLRVWWVDATTRGTFEEGLREVAVQAGVSRGEAREVWARREAARDVLWRALDDAGTGRWLLVVDNADDPSVVRDWIRAPRPGSTVVITSREQRPAAWWKQATVHAVDPIGEAHGAAMLRELAPRAGTEEEARSLSRRLGGLPLALLLVGKYLAVTSDDPVLPESHTPRSFTAYRAALDREFPGTVSALSHDPSGPLTRTWEMSLDLLEAKGAAVARPLFRLISFFAPDPLPVQLLIGSVLARASVFAGLTATGLEEAVRGLLGCGLLHRRRIEADGATVDALVVHPLVREITRMQPDAVAGAPAYTNLSVVLLERVASGLPSDDTSTWPLWRLLAPHCAYAASDTSHAAGEEWMIRGGLATQTGGYAHKAGVWSLAEEQFAHAVEILGHCLPPDDPRIVATRHNLAYLRHDQGRYDEAEAQFAQVLESALRALGPDDRTTLAARHELARLRLERGDVAYAHAELSVLAARTAEVLGPEDPATLAARHELARTLRARGDLAAARSLFEQVVGDKADSLGEAALPTLATRHELADLLLELGDAEQAHAAFTEVLELEARVQGPDHPSTLVTRNNLSRALVELGRHDEAEAELRETLAAWHRIGEEAHPMALVTRGALGGLLATTGRAAEGEKLLRTAALALERIFGAGHRETVNARLNHADSLHRLDRHADAEPLLRAVVAALADTADGEGLRVLAARRKLADICFEQGRDAEAEEELRQIVAARSRDLGAGHPETLQDRQALAAVLLRQGHTALAARQLVALVDPLDAALGRNHRDALIARSNLAHAQSQLGAEAAAKRQLRRVVAVYEEDGLVPDKLLATVRDLLGRLG
ncbi:tetratricopeptide repeat protein [Streptomyces sp. PBH53]|uniref:tetratricopeptide repeat protein n=1 Tax=Streptomyces sp. PBH53 TaxID=1577075 RepID=UPI000A4CFB93|nr:tetratricopeptide repeat protein [Streptomyces sp. PBH53]